MEEEPPERYWLSEGQTKRRLAIVGGGFSGASLALEVLNAAAGAIDVAVIDRSPAFGRGLAYSTPDPNHLLNVPAQRMSVLAGAPDDFLTWLGVTGEAGAAPGAFAARAAFGDYLEARMRRALSQAAPLSMIQAEAVSLERTNAGLRIALDSGQKIDADDVALAYGHPPARAPFDASALNAEQFRSDPWDCAAIAAIPAAHDVLLVGAGLTMIDMAMSLTPRAGTIYALSRRGLIPHAHAIGGPPAASEPLELPLALSEALQTLRKEARRLEQAGETWQRLIDRLRPDVQKFWRRMSLEQQRRFLRHARPFWDTHRHRAAPEIAARIAALRASGQLRVLAGKIEAAAPAGGKVQVRYRPRGERAAQTLVLDCIVNCTGADPSLHTHPGRLQQAASAAGLIRANANGIGLDISADGRVIGGDGAPAADLFAIGPPTQGGFWESTAVPEIRAAAAALARQIAGKVNDG